MIGPSYCCTDDMTESRRLYSLKNSNPKLVEQWVLLKISRIVSSWSSFFVSNQFFQKLPNWNVHLVHLTNPLHQNNIQNHPTSKASLSTSKVGWKSEIAGRQIKPLVASPNTGSHYNDQVRFIQNQGANITRIGQPWKIRQQNVGKYVVKIHPNSSVHPWF